MQDRYFHEFHYRNRNGVNFEVGIELIKTRKGFQYRAYDTKEDKEEPREVVHLRDCPLTRKREPSLKGIEKQVKEELSVRIKLELPPQRQSIWR